LATAEKLYKEVFIEWNKRKREDEPFHWIKIHYQKKESVFE